MDKKFLWGAATSAHQVEGNTIYSDWWSWERATRGVTPSGRATDHYHRYAEDFALARGLGHTAHRLSIEWSRLEPRRGVWDAAAARHYREVLQALAATGMTAFVTLHHFTNPQWFAARGGWERVDAPELFARYVRRAAQEFGGLVDFWITINEPIVWAQQAYWTRRWPPGAGPRASLASQRRAAASELVTIPSRALRTLRVIRRLAAAHRAAYRVLKSVQADTPVGMAKHFIAYEPVDAARRADRQYAAFLRWWFNHRFFRLTGPTHDFIGVNYYFTSPVGWRGLHPYRQPWTGPISDLQWPIHAAGLTQVLLEAARYGRPLYVTENGLADRVDVQRADFIRDHAAAIQVAQAAGADVRGYLHWSLLDNFEWDLGITPRFGLIEVDYQTMERRVRPSAQEYKKIIEQA